MTAPASILGTITVVNKHRHVPTENDVYIGRGSPLGNPYTVEAYGRAGAIARYEHWFEQKLNDRDHKVWNALAKIAERSLNGKPTYLVCFCKPQACHGDSIKEFVCERLKQNVGS